MSLLNYIFRGERHFQTEEDNIVEFQDWQYKQLKLLENKWNTLKLSLNDNELLELLKKTKLALLKNTKCLGAHEYFVFKLRVAEKLGYKVNFEGVAEPFLI